MSVSDSYVLSNIIEITGDEKSRAYWESAIRELGEAAVEEELGEMKMRWKEGSISCPKKYLTSLLQNLRKKKQPQQDESNPQNLQSYLSPSAMHFITELRPRMSADKYPVIKAERSMAQPYSGKQIPWTTFLGTDFFTLSTNKHKSDVVPATFRTGNGDVRIPLLRGRKFPGDSERGILTAEHGKLLGALENFWAQQGCRYLTGNYGNSGEVCLCYCVVSVRQLISFLGKSSSGAANTKHLKTMITDLETFPYYLQLEDIPEFKQAGIRGYGFTLLSSSALLEVNNKPLGGTIIKIIFSETYSRQLLERRVTTRSLDLVRTKSELAFLVHLYLEPILIKRTRFQKTLLSLVHELQLPAADWHKRPGARKQQFEKAVKELCNKKTGTGQTMLLLIRKEKTAGNDYILEASLTEATLSSRVEVSVVENDDIPANRLPQGTVTPIKRQEEARADSDDTLDNLSRVFDSFPEDTKQEYRKIAEQNLKDKKIPKRFISDFKIKIEVLEILKNEQQKGVSQ